jgi:hypothetical protein
VPPDRRRVAPEAGGQGDTSPTKVLIESMSLFTIPVIINSFKFNAIHNKLTTIGILWYTLIPEII